MKKLIALLMVCLFVFAFAACKSDDGDKTSSAAESTSSAAADETSETETDETSETAVSDDAAEADIKGEGVMTYAEYAAAELDTQVVIETYVQAKQSWWDNKATVYTQDKDGAYFLYNMTCTEEEYATLTVGQKIKVTGYKSEWSGEVEVIDATFELEDGTFVASATDVTSLLGTDELIEQQNKLVSFKGMTVVAYNEAGDAFAYKNDVDKTDDLYFKVSLDGEVYEFCVEYYLCSEDTDVYKAVEALKAGDIVDLEGFLYWYNGANPHITSLTVVG